MRLGLVVGSAITHIRSPHISTSEIIKGEKLEVSNWMATPDEIDGLSD